MKNIIFKISIIISLYSLLCGFSLLGAKVAALDTAPEEVVQFVWDGTVPDIDEKDEFYDGQYSDLSDKEFFLQLLNMAFEKWNEIPGSYLNMVIIESADATQDSEDNIHSIVVSQESNATTAAFAAPYIDEDEDPSIIKDCDIVMADRKATAKSIAYTLVHEIGHCIGLGHAHSNYNAIMGYSRSKRTLTLGGDDIAGLLFLYPDPDVISDEPTEVVSCSVIKNTGKKQASLPIYILLLFAPLICLSSRTCRQKALV